MKTFALPDARLGPLVPLRVGFGRATEYALRATGKIVRPPISVVGLIDTGADISLIERGLLTPFVREGMPFLSFVSVHAPGLGSLALCSQYLSGIRIGHPSGNPRDDLVLPATELVEHSFGGMGYDVLIVRDIMSKFTFTLNGPANTFTLTY